MSKKIYVFPDIFRYKIFSQLASGNEETRGLLLVSYAKRGRPRKQSDDFLGIDQGETSNIIAEEDSKSSKSEVKPKPKGSPGNPETPDSALVSKPKRGRPRKDQKDILKDQVEGVENHESLEEGYSETPLEAPTIVAGKSSWEPPGSGEIIYKIEDLREDIDSCDLKPVRYVSMSPTYMLDLEAGLQISTKDFQPEVKGLWPFFFGLKWLEKKRYWLYLAVLYTNFRDFMTKEKTYLLEASFTITRKKDFGKCPLKLEEFMLSLENLMAKLWISYDNLHPRVIIQADTIKDAEILIYTGKVPTYKLLNEAEAMKMVQAFITAIFNTLPPGFFGSTIFTRKVFEQLVLLYSKTKQEISRDMEMSGISFSDVFAGLMKGEEEVKLIPYSENLYEKTLVCDLPYEPPSFEENKVCISEAGKLFLEVISGASPYRLNVLRGLLRNILCAKEDGRNWQSAVWIWGPPATGKSFWVEICRSLVRPDELAEFSRNQNQFSSVQFQSTKLLIVSDLETLTAQQKDVLKRLLGRDPIALEEKHKQGIETINPYCQVVFASNQPPTHFRELFSDQAVLDKLIQVEFNEIEKIPSHLQIADLRDRIKNYVPMLFNWAVYTPSSLLRYFVRAQDFNSEYKRSKGETQEPGRGYPSFLQTKMWFERGEFTPIEEILTSIEIYTRETGDDAMVPKGANIKAKGNNLHAKIICTSLSIVFNETAEYKRSSKTFPGGTRPFGITNIRLKTAADENREPTESSHPLKVFIQKSNVELPDPFWTEHKVCWIQSTRDTIDANLLELKNYRLALQESKALQETISKAEKPNETGENPQIPQSFLFEEPKPPEKIEQKTDLQGQQVKIVETDQSPQTKLVEDFKALDDFGME